MKSKRDRQALGALVGAIVGLVLTVATGMPAGILLFTALAGSFIAGRAAATQ
jgi:hypothetical protein